MINPYTINAYLAGKGDAQRGTVDRLRYSRVIDSWGWPVEDCLIAYDAGSIAPEDCTLRASYERYWQDAIQAAIDSVR